MTRVETIGDCTLYLGDCREILPTVGWIVTSLPVGFLLGFAAAYVEDRGRL